MVVETLGDALAAGWRITARCGWGKREGMKSRRERNYTRELDLEKSAANVFGPGGSGPVQPAVDVKALHAKIGELTLENDFLEGALTKAGLLSAKR